MHRDICTKLDPPNGPHVTLFRNRIIEGLDGEVIFPYYNASGSDTSFKGNYAIIGRSKTDHNLALANDWTPTPIPGSSQLVQPTVVRLQPGKPALKAWFRDRRATSIYTSDSKDDGHTWTEPVKSALPNPNVGIEAFPLVSGAIVMVFNPYSKATAGPNGRTPLAVALSEDGGETWPYQRNLQVEDDDSGELESARRRKTPSTKNKYEFSYPTVLQTSHDEVIHIMYTYDRNTIKYRAINETWIKST